MRVALAATVHDTDGRLGPAIPRAAAALTAAFAGIALNITDATAQAVVSAASVHLGARHIRHPANEATIGWARRNVVALSLGIDAEAILYCDFDHVLRWIEAAPDELAKTLTAAPEADLLVVGRSPECFAEEPRRLRETEAAVNHVYTLMTGRRWDLMFAIRRLSRRAAEEIIRSSLVDTVANDVEWPLLAERAGLSLGYAEADGLYYRTMDEFGAARDTHDDEAMEWIRRLEFAAAHAAAFRPFLKE